MRQGSREEKLRNGRASVQGMHLMVRDVSKDTSAKIREIAGSFEENGFILVPATDGDSVLSFRRIVLDGNVALSADVEGVLRLHRLARSDPLALHDQPYRPRVKEVANEILKPRRAGCRED